MKRLKQVEGVIIDEISMIPGQAMVVAEALARNARGSSLPWGGMRVLVVGDFTQLPPVTRTRFRDWCFIDPVWKKSGFQMTQLNINQRVHDLDYMKLLQNLRFGKLTSSDLDFLDGKVIDYDDPEAVGTRLFPRRDQTEDFNQKKLREIQEEEVVYDSIYFGQERAIESLKKSSPVPEKLVLKRGCKVIFLQNDPQKRWINGTQGLVTDLSSDQIKIQKFAIGGKTLSREVTVEKTSLVYQDADGNVVASVIQFPLNLGYSTTIHKSQGATLEDLTCDLGALWEPGQAYVALSRLRESQGLKLLRWNPRSVIVDPQVVSFYQNN
jgi:ATP-dependent exoDNAse (exonuclease V) alpha subunit